MIGLSFVLWTILFVAVTKMPIPLENIYCKLKEGDKFDVQNRVVSAIHGTILMVFSGYQFYFSQRQCGDVNTNFERNLIYTAVGYFSYDLLCMKYYGLLDWAMLMHHCFTSFGMFLALVRGSSASLIVMGMFVAEVSNPFMHIRVILKHIGLRYTKAYETFEISFIMMYCYARIFCGCWLVWQTCSCNDMFLF